MGVRTTAHSQIFNPCKTIINNYMLHMNFCNIWIVKFKWIVKFSCCYIFGHRWFSTYCALVQKAKQLTDLYLHIWIWYVCIFIFSFMDFMLKIISFGCNERLYFEFDIFAKTSTFESNDSLSMFHIIVSIQLYLYHCINMNLKCLYPYL